MREYLGEYDNMLIFADEDFKGMNTNEFALFLQIYRFIFLYYSAEIRYTDFHIVMKEYIPLKLVAGFMN